MKTSWPPITEVGSPPSANGTKSSASDEYRSAPDRGTAGDALTKTVDTVRSEAGSVAASLSSDVKEAAKTATRAAKEQATIFAADVGHELSKTAEEQKQHGVEALQGFARAINVAAAEMESQSPRVAHYVREAAGKVEGLSGNIGSRNVSELMRAATDLARAQPLMFFGGAVAAGFALSRFLKSSATHHPAQPSAPNGADQS